MAENLAGMVRENVIILQRKMRANPNDSTTLDAIFNLSLNLRYGRDGYPQDGTLEREALELAANYGHQRACYERARVEINNPKRALYYVELGLRRNPEDQQLRGLEGALGGIQRQKESNEKQLAEAEHMFRTKSGLEDAIRSEIFPCVVSIVTSRGTIGSGFYQYSEWLMSNAHVVPSSEILAESSLLDFRSNRTALVENRAFYRPSKVTTSPDVVIINGNSRGSGNNKCLPINFTRDDDSGKRIIFYVFFNHETKKHQINYLKLRSRSDSFPMTYECEDGVEPRPGCSGAPVIAARLLVGGSEIKWQFETVGIVYARCLSEDNKQLVCAIPVSQEFKQILETILNPEMHAERAAQMAYASTKVIEGSEKSAKYTSDSEAYAALALSGLKEFEAGKTRLSIHLLDGLEKLLGKTIIDLYGSAFLFEVQNAYNITDINIRRKFKVIEELADDLYQFFEMIKSLEKLPALSIRNEYMLSPKEYFRIDVGGGGNKPFVFDIQDNIGKKNQHAPPPRHNEPISSKFAIASILKRLEQITGMELAKSLIESLTPRTRQFLKSIKESNKKEKEVMLPMWQAHCNKDKWGGITHDTENDAIQELMDTEHINHGGFVQEVKDDSSSDDILDFDDSKTTSPTTVSSTTTTTTTTTTNQKVKVKKK